METRNFRQEMHVAQQSRRERLRIQQQFNHPGQNLEAYTNSTLEQVSGHEDLIQLQRFKYGNLAYNPPIFSAEMANFTAHSQAWLAQNKDVPMVHQESSSSGIDKQIGTNMNGDPQNYDAWKSVGSHENRNWPIYCTSGSVSMERHPKTIIEESSDSLQANPSGSVSCMRPNYYDYEHVKSSLTGSSSEIPSWIGQKNYADVQCAHPSVNQNVTYDLGIAAFAQENAREPCHLSWANASNALRLGSGGIAEEVEARGLGNDVANEKNKTNGQALSLSLSSVPLTKQNLCRVDERLVSQELQAGGDYLQNILNAKALMSDYTNLGSKPSLSGNSTLAQRGAAGPLGPFTGYATILKTSKFLKPAQQLLHEFCSCANPRDREISTKNVQELRPCGDDVNPVESVGGGALDGHFGGSRASPFSSSEKTQEAAGSSSSNDSCRPEILQKKAKLLYMLEEICRRYKHFHQQMQMVVSSFESVAGLGAATPYISVALKTTSRLFRSLRTAISDHLRSVKKALGEDFSSFASGASSSKCDMSSSWRKLIDNTYTNTNQKVVASNVGFFEPQQHVWRPQRGLPERAVAILRAWLFDHFLHPYPTDSDKHMLASQTGLTRNQVSNWFINARVRIWKPMVEEIHSLEAKAAAETGTNVGKSDGKAGGTDDGSCSNASPPMNAIPTTGLPGKQVEFPGIGVSRFPGNPTNAPTWNQDASIVDFATYGRGGIDLGGLGAVSLTLGLRQNVGGSGQQQHLSQQQSGNQLRRHFGDHIVYDFVG